VATAPAVTTIDLGEMPQIVEVVPPARPRLRIRRWQRLAVCALLLAGTVAGSGIPVAIGLPVVARIPIGGNARLLITGSTAIVSDRRDGDNEVEAYDLVTGHSRWRAPLSGTSVNARMFVASSTVVVETQHDIGYDQAEGFALGTGAVRWRMPALMVTPIPVGLLVYMRVAGDGIDAALVDPVSGAQRWRTPLGGDCDINLATDPAQTMATGLVEVCQGTVRIVALDLATGRIRARVRPDLFPRAETRGPIPNLGPGTERVVPRLSIAYLGAVTIVAMPHRYPGRLVSAFRTSDLAPLWLGVTMTRNGSLHACGLNICDDLGSAFDPATGVTVPGPPATGPIADTVAAHRPVPGATTTLVIIPPGGAVAAPAIASIDYLTPLPEGIAAAVPGPAAGAVWFAVPAGHGIRPLLFLPGVGAASWAVVSAYVACTTALDRLVVYSLAAPDQIRSK
jgi:hypothetical protein